MYFIVLLLIADGRNRQQSVCAGSVYLVTTAHVPRPQWQGVYLLPPGPSSGAGKNRSSRTSPGTSQAMAAFFAHASASSILAASSIQNPPMCSLVSVYGPSVISTLPLGCLRSVFALAAGEMPQANFLTPAAINSRLSAWISSIIDSVTVDGSKSSGR